MTTIDLHELTKDYGPKRVVDRITCSVRSGRVTGFLGPNGAGKSTTMRLVLGLDRPTSGRATVGGRPFTTERHPQQVVGALLDPFAIHPSRTALGHLSALAAVDRIPRRRVDEVLGQVGLEAVARKRIKTFSLGMRQRLGIAAALLGDPPVLMLDEPSNGLDPEGIIWLRTTLRGLAAEGRTVFVSSHLMTETASFADHLVVLGRGRILADTSVGEFIDHYAQPRVRIRTDAPEPLLTVLAGAGFDPFPGEPGCWYVPGARVDTVGPVLVRAAVPVLELADEAGTLEQAYLALTADAVEFTPATSSRTAPEKVM
ncbi:ABC transporter ATP-binding protein [Nocardia stercoris]|uniref:ATP-binding cassette domain-containing protein n=1 Tax=Nocardia stercoris TaxID=2483361 RepID=A0A3M2L5P0_9NOCA|nr:ATP-binding cassette domain-containing protein [Nocardia stercoris]RMI31195.1 ATP-binding cassette domain-containing protein [Nocardia stercoris]